MKMLISLKNETFISGLRTGFSSAQPAVPVWVTLFKPLLSAGVFLSRDQITLALVVLIIFMAWLVWRGQPTLSQPDSVAQRH